MGTLSQTGRHLQASFREFDFAEGKAVGNPAPTIRYYFNGPGSVEPPELEDNLHSSWLAAGWKYVENPGEPVQNLQGGEYILYGVASSGQHRIRSRPITMRVTSSIAPDVWVSEPVMDESKLDTGAVSIKSGEAAVETQTDAEGNTIATVQADPLPDYRHYYAPYSTDTETGIENAPTPPVDNYDRSWKDGQLDRNDGRGRIAIALRQVPFLQRGCKQRRRHKARS